MAKKILYWQISLHERFLGSTTLNPANLQISVEKKQQPKPGRRDVGVCVSEVAVVVVVAFISRQRIREWQERGGLTQQHQNGVGVVAVVEKGRW